MAVSNKPRGRFWSHLHFWLRFLGLTGLLAAGVGAVLAGIQGLAARVPAWDGNRAAADNLRALWDFARTTEGWKITRRTLRPLDGSAPAREILRGALEP